MHVSVVTGLVKYGRVIQFTSVELASASLQCTVSVQIQTCSLVNLGLHSPAALPGSLGSGRLGDCGRPGSAQRPSSVGGRCLVRPFPTEHLLLLLPLVTAFSGAASTPDLPLPLSRACGLGSPPPPRGPLPVRRSHSPAFCAPEPVLCSWAGKSRTSKRGVWDTCLFPHCGDQGTPLFVNTC